jgi:hypothetical protein
MHPALERFTALSAVAAMAATLALPSVASAGHPAAGPWYTGKELKALITFSNASFSEKQRILAGVPTG